jgi:hypothetical protein
VRVSPHGAVHVAHVGGRLLNVIQRVAVGRQPGGLIRAEGPAAPCCCCCCPAPAAAAAAGWRPWPAVAVQQAVVSAPRLLTAQRLKRLQGWSNRIANKHANCVKLTRCNSLLSDVQDAFDDWRAQKTPQPTLTDNQRLLALFTAQRLKRLQDWSRRIANKLANGVKQARWRPC